LLLKTLSRNDRYGLLVRNFDFRSAGWLVTGNGHRLFNRALNRLHNLESLTINNTHIIASIFEGCTFSLNRFSTSIVYDNALSRFLTSQSTITELCLSGKSNSQDPFILPSTALPRLKYFRTLYETPILLAQVVGGRPVHSISIVVTQAQTSTNKALDALTFSSVPLEALSVLFWISPALCELLPAIARRFPALVELGIFVPAGAQYTSEALEESAPLLSVFKQLDSIKFFAPSIPSAIDDQQKIAETWRKHCPTLQIITFPNETFRFQGGQVSIHTMI